MSTHHPAALLKRKVKFAHVCIAIKRPARRMWRSNTIAGTATLENSLAGSLKLQHTFTTDPAISFLGLHPRKIKAHIHTKSCCECP
jgi:hypothetical protein